MPDEDVGCNSVLAPAKNRYPGFGRCHRLRTAAEFSRVLRRGRRIRGEAFTVVWLPGPAAGPRLGLAIAKRHQRRAVARNRAKRVIRESFRQASIDHQVDVVVLNKRDTAHLGVAAWRGELDHQWRKLSHQLINSPT